MKKKIRVLGVEGGNRKLKKKRRRVEIKAKKKEENDLIFCDKYVEILRISATLS